MKIKIIKYWGKKKKEQVIIGWDQSMLGVQDPLTNKEQNKNQRFKSSQATPFLKTHRRAIELSAFPAVGVGRSPP